MITQQKIFEEDLQHVYNIGEKNWELLRNKSIFVTGATGFFGKWLLESFLYINEKLSLNAHVCALSRNPASFKEKHPYLNNQSSISFLEGDVQNFNFPVEDFDFIIHAATDADAALNVSDPLLMVDTITIGTRRMLDFAKQQNELKSFLFVSSGAIYGKQPSTVTHIKENEGYFVDINNPQSAYAEGKRLSELYCSIYNTHFSIPIKIARCFAFVGPYLPLNKHFAIGNFIANTLNGEDITIKGDGTPFRSYLYAADLTVWLWTILLKGQNNTSYNVGSDEDYDLKTIANLFTEINPSISVNILLSPLVDKPVDRYVPDISFIQQQLELKVNVKLIEAIKRTLAFYEKDDLGA